jgi:hypothetical protein
MEASGESASAIFQAIGPESKADREPGVKSAALAAVLKKFKKALAEVAMRSRVTLPNENWALWRVLQC